MSDEAKKQPIGPQKTIINTSRHGRKHVLRDGRELLPGGSAEVGLEEFKKLVGYRDLVDADKIVPHAAKRLDEALKENKALRAKADELEKGHAPLKAKAEAHDGLKKALDEVNGKYDEAQKEIAALKKKLK